MIQEPRFSSTKSLACPICGQAVATSGNSSMPFCSSRCKNVDLNRWFNEEIRLPLNPEAEEEPDEYWD
ncbi:MAG: DNA gyrase inhibitor YacG [Pirellulaceae bacterium]